MRHLAAFLLVAPFAAVLALGLSAGLMLAAT
jgi:hypothetical protein